MQHERSESPPFPADASTLAILGHLRRHLAGAMVIEGHAVPKPPDNVFAFRGRVEGDAEAAFETITERFASLGYTAWLRDLPDGGHEVLATRGLSTPRPGRLWLNVALFVATFATVLFVGATYGLADAQLAGNVPPDPGLLHVLANIHLGVPYAVTLMGILLAHELSHYFVSRRYGSSYALPYFIPMLNIFGTMGALIVQRGPMRSRKAVLDIGAAGPLGGLIVAIPLLFLGLALSEVGSVPSGTEVVLQEGNSLLYLGVKYIVFGQILPANGVDVWLHPVAFAAWAGLFVTMLNLVPVGQLDGGHISYALLGRRARLVGQIVVVALITWGGWLLLRGNQGGGVWLMWGFLNMLLNRRHPAPLNAVTGPDPKRMALALLVVVLFIVMFMPSPLQQIQLDPDGALSVQDLLIRLL